MRNSSRRRGRLGNARVMLAWCGGTGTTERPLYRVHLVARGGPTTPVCQASSRCERPFHGRFDLIHDGHRTAIATDTRGHAILDVPAGTYQITTDRAIRCHA